MSETKNISLHGLRTFLQPLIRLINRKAESWEDLKGKPFGSEWEEKTLVSSATYTISEDGGYEKISENLIFVEGQTYTVTFDGTQYECVAWAGEGDSICIGNGDIYASPGKGNGEPFCCDSYSDGNCYLNVQTAGTYTIVITGQVETIKKLDSKYIDVELPEGILTTSNYLETTAGKQIGDNGEVFNNYDANFASYMAHAEGSGTEASGIYSHAEGLQTWANNECAHAEGYYTQASGSYAHAEGRNTYAIGDASHAEGDGTHAYGENSHAEGKSTSIGNYAHAEGYDTFAVGQYSHGEGSGSKKLSTSLTRTSDPLIYQIKSRSTTSDFTIYAIALNNDNYYKILKSSRTGNTSGYDYIYEITVDREIPADVSLTNVYLCQHAALGQSSHVEGMNNKAYGKCSHVEGTGNEAHGYVCHAEGYYTESVSDYSHSEGKLTRAEGIGSHSEGGAHEGYITLTGNDGDTTYQLGSVNRAKIKIGDRYVQKDNNSNINLDVPITNIDYENKTITFADTIGAENGIVSRRIVVGGRAVGEFSHVEGIGTSSLANYGHAEGKETLVSGDGGHAENLYAVAKGAYSHAEGIATIAAGKSQHVQGRLNIEDSENKYAHIVGNGTSYPNYPLPGGGYRLQETRSNAHTLDWDGNAWFSGDVYVKSTSGTNMDEGSKKLATEDYVKEYTNITVITNAEIDAICGT